jgi:hypothetical protein
MLILIMLKIHLLIIKYYEIIKYSEWVMEKSGRGSGYIKWVIY